MCDLPSWTPTTYWIVSPDGFVPKPWAMQSVYPEVQKVNGHTVIDRIAYPIISRLTCETEDWVYKLKCWNNLDHPNKEALPDGCPRSVKRLYDASFQLYVLRMTDCNVFSVAINKARGDWKEFVDNVNHKVVLLSGVYLKLPKRKQRMNKLNELVYKDVPQVPATDPVGPEVGDDLHDISESDLPAFLERVARGETAPEVAQDKTQREYTDGSDGACVEGQTRD